jgi:hypothetical protein
MLVSDEEYRARIYGCRMILDFLKERQKDGATFEEAVGDAEKFIEAIKDAYPRRG